MGIVKQYCKKTDTYYVYESTSYYRPDKKRCYYKRKLIGKIDPDTGEVIPTGRRGRPSKSTTSDAVETDYRKLYLEVQKELVKAESKIKTLQSELEKEQQTVARYKERIQEITSLCSRKI